MLEHACLDFSSHANARISYFDDALVVLSHHPQSDCSTSGQRIDRIENQIGQELAELCRRAMDGWVGLRFDEQADGPTFDLRGIAPPRRRKLRGLAHHFAQVDRLLVPLRRCPRELQEPLDRHAPVQSRLSGRRQQVLELDEIRRILQQRLAGQVAVAGHQHQRLVEIVGDARGHLAQSAQLF